MRSFPAIIVPALVVSLTTPAVACSVSSEYRVPTTFELVNQSDAIVLAKVDGDRSPGRFDNSVVVTPETLIAGDSMPERLELVGVLARGRSQPVSSDPMELARPNPDAMTGSCNRYIFSRGMLLLLFLERQDDGSFRVINAPFARTLEDVADADALWVRAVRYYASLRGMDAAARRAAMEAERERLSGTGIPSDHVLAQDIARHIANRRMADHD